MISKNKINRTLSLAGQIIGYLLELIDLEGLKAKILADLGGDPL